MKFVLIHSTQTQEVRTISGWHLSVSKLYHTTPNIRLPAFTNLLAWLAWYIEFKIMNLFQVWVLGVNIYILSQTWCSIPDHRNKFFLTRIKTLLLSRYQWYHTNKYSRYHLKNSLRLNWKGFHWKGKNVFPRFISFQFVIWYKTYTYWLH